MYSEALRTLYPPGANFFCPITTFYLLIGTLILFYDSNILNIAECVEEIKIIEITSTK
jgi:hypothetical protein